MSLFYDRNVLFFCLTWDAYTGRPVSYTHLDVYKRQAPYLGIYHFIEGNYEQAMNLFSRASRKLLSLIHIYADSVVVS